MSIKLTRLILLLLIILPSVAAAQERYLVAYGGFAGFQAPAWAGKDLGLFSDRKSTRLNSSHIQKSRMPSSA